MKTQTTALVAALALATVLLAPALLAQSRITGVPLDDEYLIFVIDTSGSMRRFEWDRVMETVRETLADYPTLRGMQVLDDEGEHLLVSYRNEWIPDTPTNRAWILDELEDWNAYSTSNPRRGILTAIDRYTTDPDRKIALYVLGDDFSSGAEAIDPLLREVAARNLREDAGPRVRINTIAFPIFYDQLGASQFATSTGADMAGLMAVLSQQSGGTFLALPSRRVVEVVSAAPEGALPAPADPERVLIVIDASAGMRAPDWEQAVAAVEQMLADVGAGEFFQVMVLGDEARSVIAATDGEWQSDPDGSQREQVLATLRGLVPSGAADLREIAAAVGGLTPAPDSVYLLAASDPALGPDNYPLLARETTAVAPLDLLLFAAENNRQAVPFYWSLALASGGSLVAPAEDWP